MDIHEDEPSHFAQFEDSMIVTVEPGFYFSLDLEIKIPDRFKGIGVRIEDDILITKEGRSVLTKKTPKEIEEIERIMKGNK